MSFYNEFANKSMSSHYTFERLIVLLTKSEFTKKSFHILIV